MLSPGGRWAVNGNRAMRRWGPGYRPAACWSPWSTAWAMATGSGDGGAGRGRRLARVCRGRAAVSALLQALPPPSAAPPAARRCAVAMLDAAKGTLTWAGVGNVEACSLRSAPRALTEQLLVRGGVVGRRLPSLEAVPAGTWPGVTSLILATDGVQGVSSRTTPAPPSRHAGRRPSASSPTHGKETDDALVLVVQIPRPGGLNASVIRRSCRRSSPGRSKAASRRWRRGRLALGVRARAGGRWLPGFGVLDVATLLHEALLVACLRRPDRQPRRWSGKRASSRSNALSPFEMAHRAVREANAALRGLNDHLEEQTRRISRRAPRPGGPAPRLGLSGPRRPRPGTCPGQRGRAPAGGEGPPRQDRGAAPPAVPRAAADDSRRPRAGRGARFSGHGLRGAARASRSACRGAAKSGFPDPSRPCSIASSRKR